MIWLATFLVFLLVVAGMAIGVMMGRKPIAGSCGGIASLGIEKECSICGGDMTKCEEANKTDGDSTPSAQGQSYDATKV